MRKGELVTPFKGLNGKPLHWVETAPFVWRDPDGHERLAAKVVDGKAVRFSIDGISPFMVFDRVPGSENGAWLLPAFYCAMGALLLTAVFWPITAIVRRRFGATLALRSGGAARLSFQQDRIDFAGRGAGTVGVHRDPHVQRLQQSDQQTSTGTSALRRCSAFWRSFWARP